MQPLFRYSIVTAVVVLPLCFLGGSCAPPDEPGKVDVSGCVLVPLQFSQSWQQGQLAVVAREKSTRTLKAYYYVSKSDTTCYKRPESCPTYGTLSGLSDGQYFILLEAHDPVFTSSKGKNGTATAVGYYEAPANKTGPGGLAPDASQATVIQIDAKHKKHSITFDAP